MRKEEQVRIDDKTIVVIQELRIIEIKQLIADFGKITMGEFLDKACKAIFGMESEKFLNYCPSEIQALLEAAKRVNQSFLAIPDFLNMIGMKENYEKIVIAYKTIINETMDKIISDASKAIQEV